MLKKAGLVAAAVVAMSMIAPSIASADPIDDDPCMEDGSAALSLDVAVDALLQGGEAAVADVTAALSTGIDAGLDVGLSLTGALVANCGC